jgi:hypothetical protein
MDNERDYLENFHTDINDINYHTEHEFSKDLETLYKLLENTTLDDSLNTKKHNIIQYYNNQGRFDREYEFLSDKDIDFDNINHVDYYFRKILNQNNLSINDFGKRYKELFGKKVNFNNTHLYVSQIANALKVIDNAFKFPEYAYNLIKTTRAGCTTSMGMATLIRNKSILIVEPTNKIAYDVVEEVHENYERLTLDFTKKRRAIPSNKDGCSFVQSKIFAYENLKEMPYIISKACDGCKEHSSYPIGQKSIPKATRENCTIKTMMDETKEYGTSWKPDILTITYDKLLSLKYGQRGEYFKKLIDNVDIILFDEIGDFVSNSDNGIELKKVTTTSGYVEVKNIAKIMNSIKMKLFIDMEEHQRVVFTEFIQEFVRPFINEVCIPAIDNEILPVYIDNSPFQQKLCKAKIKQGNITKTMLVPKLEALENKIIEIYELLEELIYYATDEKKDLIIWLINIMKIMTCKTLVVYETHGLVHNDDRTESEIDYIKLSPMIDEKVKELAEFTHNKVVFFTDATMPCYNFDAFGKRFSDFYFGDPNKTNQNLLMVNDKNVERFSNHKWFKDSNYRKLIMIKIEQSLYYFGEKGIIIWTPNIKICNSVIKELTKRGIEVQSGDEDINFSEITDLYGKYNKYSNKLKSKKDPRVMVTYYGGSIARGVETKQLYQIMLGKANKPKGSYKHLAYMQRVQWEAFDDRVIESMALEFELTTGEFKRKINSWMRKKYNKDKVIMKKTLPLELKTYFEKYAEVIQMEKTYMDTWQAGSRAKDSKGIERCVLLCLGWNTKDIWEMVKWGSNKSVKYIPFRDTLNRTLLNQENIIAPPNAIEIVDYVEIKKWFEGGDIVNDCVGFSDDLDNGIMEMLIRGRKYVTTEEIWMELSKNLPVGNLSEDYTNGYLIGTIRAFLLYNDFGEDIICKENNSSIYKFTSPKYTFTLSKTPKIIKSNHKMYDKFLISKYNDIRLISEILKTVYRIKKDKVSLSDILNYNKKLSKPEFTMTKNPVITIKRIYNFMYSKNLLLGTSWKFVDRMRKGKMIFDIQKNMKETAYDIIIGTAPVDVKKKLRLKDRKVIECIIDWNYNGKTNKYNYNSNYMELTLKDIKRETKLDVEDIKEVIKKFFNENHNHFGLKCLAFITKDKRGERVSMYRTSLNDM